jgi:enterochelin esterase-like enzyme
MKKLVWTPILTGALTEDMKTTIKRHVTVAIDGNSFVKTSRLSQSRAAICAEPTATKVAVLAQIKEI